MPRGTIPINSICFAVEKKPGRHPSLANGEVRLPVIVEVGGWRPALFAVEHDAALGSGYSSEIARAIAAQQKTPTDIITRVAPGHTEVVLRQEQISQAIAIEILST